MLITQTNLIKTCYKIVPNAEVVRTDLTYLLSMISFVSKFMYMVLSKLIIDYLCQKDHVVQSILFICDLYQSS